MSERVGDAGVVLLGFAGVSGLVLIATGGFSGYVQATWGVTMLASALLVIYGE